jgi:hypothetical protein
MAGQAPDLDPEKHASSALGDAKISGAGDNGSSSTLDGNLNFKATKETASHPDCQHSLTTTHSRSHSRSRSSSLDTDPLSPLEHALARASSLQETDLAIAEAESPPVDLAHAHTRTSITSAASRPPDFEVTLDRDDPENPRNWQVLLLHVSQLFGNHHDVFCANLDIETEREQPSPVEPTAHHP